MASGNAPRTVTLKRGANSYELAILQVKVSYLKKVFKVRFNIAS